MNSEIFYLIVFFFLLFSAYKISVEKNPIQCVLFLILVFLSAAVILYMLEANFFALMFIIIYVGAIATLFLFAIMMLDLKGGKAESATTQFINNKFFFIIAFLCVCFLSYNIIFHFLKKNFVVFFDNSFLNDDFYLALAPFLVDNFTNIEIFGQALYNYNIILVFLSGLVLIIALVGSITLVIQKNKFVKPQAVFKQLSKKSNSNSFFK